MKKKLLIAFVATAVMMAVMSIHGRPLAIPNKTPPGIVSFELARTPAEAGVILKAWTPALLPLARVNTYLDFIFIACYGWLLWLVCHTLANRFVGRWLANAVIVVSAFDIFKNILMFKTMNGLIGNELVASTFMFASAKFVLLASAILYIVASVVANLPVF